MEQPILDKYIVIKKSKLKDFNDDLCELADFYFLAKDILEENVFPLKPYEKYRSRKLKNCFIP